MTDFLLLELEQEIGGNARAGSSAGGAYPWGAHYLPLPGPDARYTRQMLAEFGLLDQPEAIAPRYDERHLCHSPQERLFINGSWQDGLLPQYGVHAGEQAQLQRFQQQMDALRQGRGQDGRPLFTIPMHLSSQDPRWLALDQISMHDWLLREGYTAAALHWYVNYGCRDDYGTDYKQTSAWAGLHYFASRHGQAANADGEAVLTWPEGNAWLARRLAQRFASQQRCGEMVYQLREQANGLEVLAYHAQSGQSIRYQCQRLVWASPLALLPRVWRELPVAWQAGIRDIDYAPWLVAQLHLSQPPDDGRHAPLSWDNVLYQGQGLGYVYAQHQSLALRQPACTLSYYRPLSEANPAAGRQLLWRQSQADWAAQIVADLAPAHPELAAHCQQLDVWRWPHAMIRPLPGSLHNPARQALRQPAGRVCLAHADLSGMSLFEEAQYWGVQAAQWLLGASSQKGLL